MYEHETSYQHPMLRILKLVFNKATTSSSKQISIHQEYVDAQTKSESVSYMLSKMFKPNVLQKLL